MHLSCVHPSLHVQIVGLFILLCTRVIYHSLLLFTLSPFVMKDTDQMHGSQMLRQVSALISFFVQLSEVYMSRLGFFAQLADCV